MPERDGAAVDIDLRGIEVERRGCRRLPALRMPRSVRPDRAARRRCRRAQGFRVAGIGPMPITEGSTPATADARRFAPADVAR